MTSALKKKLVPAAIVLIVAAVGFYAWTKLRPSGPGKDFVKGNGRIEATEIDVATKLAGRVPPAIELYDALALAIQIGQQHQGRHEQTGHHHTAPERRVADQFLQAEEIPRRFRGIRRMNRVGEFFQRRVVRYIASAAPSKQ